MHEFSIVQSIVNIALESAHLHHVEHVSAVEVEVGAVSGVVIDAMEFAWKAATTGTLLSKALLRIKYTPLMVKCNSCQHHYQPEDIYEACPQCGEISPEIITGKELKVLAIET
jgi:hydrogenase nickel incorporation protein HypA/HybF